MTTIIGQQAFDSPGDALEHYGVKGMKWGVRRKPSAAEIRGARIRMQEKGLKYQKQREAVKSTKKGSVERAKENQKLGKIKADFLKDPDRVTAMTMTRGEKAATVILGGGLPGVAAVAGQNIARNRVAKKQALGAYDKD
jgi:hypothetical protein